MIYNGLLQRWLNRAGAVVCVSPSCAFGCPSLCPNYVLWESGCPSQVFLSMSEVPHVVIRLSLSVSELRHVGVLLPLSVSELRSTSGCPSQLSLSVSELRHVGVRLSLSVSELRSVGVRLSLSAVPLCVLAVPLGCPSLCPNYVMWESYFC